MVAVFWNTVGSWCLSGTLWLFSLPSNSNISYQPPKHDSHVNAFLILCYSVCLCLNNTEFTHNLNAAAARPVTLSIAYTFDFYIFIYLIYARLAADGRLMYRPNSDPPSKLNFFIFFNCKFGSISFRIHADVFFSLEFTVVLVCLYETRPMISSRRLFQAIVHCFISNLFFLPVHFHTFL